MRAGELLLRYQHLDERAHALEDQHANLEQRLTSHPEVEYRQSELDSARGRHAEARRRLESLDREINTHLTRMRAHQKELMSGRVRNPSDLSRMSDEVDHMKASLATEEEEEFTAMVAVESAQAEEREAERMLKQVEDAAEQERPSLEQRLSETAAQLDELRHEMAQLWADVPADYRAAYDRLARVQPRVAEVERGLCGGCHVALTAGQMQQVRRGEQLLTCESCSRILVAV